MTTDDLKHMQGSLDMAFDAINEARKELDRASQHASTVAQYIREEFGRRKVVTYREEDT